MSILDNKKCIPCEGGVVPLSSEEIAKYLSAINDWLLQENKLVKEFKMKDFLTAIDFVDKIAKIAEQEGHHPNIYLHDWNKVKITLYTHAIGGLHLNDFILAAKIDKL